ncbi:unnamed protein product [Prunus armeniaca]
MEGSNQAAPVDIENPYIPLEISMRQELGRLSPLPSSCCIYRVPERLRLVNENAYTPQVVSIGPLHHGKKGLEIKRDTYRNFYVGPNDEFVRIILVDAAFIIELLLKHDFGTRRKENDRIFNKPEKFLDLMTDMQLLEKLVTISKFVTDLSLTFFTLTTTLMNEADQEFILKRLSSTKKVEHFLDLILRSLCQSEVVPSIRLDNLTTPSGTELYQAGVKFKVGSRKNIFDIRFTDGILEIPKIRVEDHTEISLRNLLAFEQCHYDHKYVGDYMIIMDRFVNNASDVDLLVDRGIIENVLGDRKEVAALFNNLGIGIFGSPDFTFANLCQDLNRYCSSTRHKRMANLRQNYFNTPWRTLSVIAAVVLLILTLIQTVCSIISAARA